MTESSQAAKPQKMRETQPIIGSRMRDLRKAKKMTLKQVAAESGLSVGYLSQLENNIATPSIRALSDLARCLDVNVGWFFPDMEDGSNPESSIVVRGKKRSALRFDSGIRDELLSPGLGGQLELMMCSFEPGACSGEELYAHDGEEAGYIAEGQLELTVEDTVIQLEQGDSFQFASSRPHRYRNNGKVKTVVIWAMTPPHY